MTSWETCFKAYKTSKIQELPRASPPWPPPVLCHGPTGRPPDPLPQIVLSPTSIPRSARDSIILTHIHVKAFYTEYEHIDAVQSSINIVWILLQYIHVSVTTHKRTEWSGYCTSCHSRRRK
jgi:hypothetical protein